jgi:hypothetical protein
LLFGVSCCLLALLPYWALVGSGYNTARPPGSQVEGRGPGGGMSGGRRPQHSHLLGCSVHPEPHLFQPQLARLRVTGKLGGQKSMQKHILCFSNCLTQELWWQFPTPVSLPPHTQGKVWKHSGWLPPERMGDASDILSQTLTVLRLETLDCSGHLHVLLLSSYLPLATCGGRRGCDNLRPLLAKPG